MGAIEQPASSPVKRALKAVVRFVLWPARRFVDPRVQGLLGHVDMKHEALQQRIEDLESSLTERLVSLQELQEASADAQQESATVLGRTLDDILRETEKISEVFDLPEKVEQLDSHVARFLNHALSHSGFSAQEGLWFNPPLSIEHRKRGVDLMDVTERIAEIPYVFRALAPLPPGARILDVGAAESTNSLSLASLGYKVTALDPRPYRLSHPNLRTVESRIEGWNTDEAFDAVVCLSTIEHVGLAAYEQDEEPDADLAAMRRIHELTKPDGLLVLTTPYGSFHVDSFQRTYDRERLDELLEGWEIADFTVLRQTGRTCWQVKGGKEPGAESRLVALVTARRSS